VRGVIGFTTFCCFRRFRVLGLGEDTIGGSGGGGGGGSDTLEGFNGVAVTIHFGVILVQHHSLLILFAYYTFYSPDTLSIL